MLTTLLRITSGIGVIQGFDVEKQDKDVRKKIGVALQDTGIDNILMSPSLPIQTVKICP